MNPANPYRPWGQSNLSQERPSVRFKYFNSRLYYFYCTLNWYMWPMTKCLLKFCGSVNRIEHEPLYTENHSRCLFSSMAFLLFHDALQSDQSLRSTPGFHYFKGHYEFLISVNISSYLPFKRPTDKNLKFKKLFGSPIRACWVL